MKKTIFVDTSAFYAILCQDEANHKLAGDCWATLLRETDLACNNYVVVETHALVQRRLGMRFVRLFENDVIPVLQVQWVQVEDHEQALRTMLAADRRSLSLVDCASFVTMHRLGLDTAFAFDAHFADQGFTCLPGVSALSSI